MRSARRQPVLVTGVAGFLGSHLAERLLARGDAVVGVDSFAACYAREIKEANLARSRACEAFSFLEADVRDEARMHDLMASVRPASVVHLAARAGVAPSLEDPAGYHDVNVLGTVSVLQAARRAGARKVVLASSSSVYGERGGSLLLETDAADRPLSPYAASKRAAELVCHAFSHATGLPVCCARFFTVYGPRQRPDMAIARFAVAIREGLPIRLFGGATARDYTYVDDIVDGLLGILEGDFGFDLVNLGSGRPVPLEDLVVLLEAELGRVAVVRREPERAFDPRATHASIARAAERYGYRPRIPIEEGIRRYLAWLSARDRDLGTGREVDDPRSPRIPVGV